MKIGDLVIDESGEISYVVEVNKEEKTVVTFSVKPGRYQPTVYQFTDLRVVENKQQDDKRISI